MSLNFCLSIQEVSRTELKEKGTCQALDKWGELPLVDEVLHTLHEVLLVSLEDPEFDQARYWLGSALEAETSTPALNAFI